MRSDGQMGNLTSALGHTAGGEAWAVREVIFLSFFSFFRSFIDGAKHSHNLLIRDVRLVRFGIDEQWIDRPGFQVINQPEAEPLATANICAVNAKLPDPTMPSRNRTSRFRPLFQGFKGWRDIRRCTRIALGQFGKRCKNSHSAPCFLGLGWFFEGAPLKAHLI
jgi:hypothetical protein